MEMSSSIANLAKALAVAQGQFQPVQRTRTASVKTSKGYEYTYTYADLAAVIEATRDALSANGIAQVQDVTREADGIRVKTILFHASGEYLSSELHVPIADFGNNDTQAMGGTITYARRYALSAILGIASEEDTDARTPAPEAPKTQRKPPREEQAPPANLAGCDFDTYNRRRKEVVARLADITEPEGGGGWSLPEKNALESKELLAASGKSRDLGLLDVLLLRAEIGQAVYGTERWIPVMNTVHDLGTNLEDLRALKASLVGAP